MRYPGSDLSNSIVQQRIWSDIRRYLAFDIRFCGRKRVFSEIDTFDFSERMLMRLAEDFGARGDYDEALGFIDLNLEFFPQSSRTYVLRAQVLTETGDIDGARENYRKAIELEPESGWLKQQLAGLDQRPESS